MLTMFTTGTWQILYMADWLMKKEADYIYDKRLFDFFTTGSLFVYLCHDFWITIITVYILRPEKSDKATTQPKSALGISFRTAIWLMIIGVEVLSNLTYYLFVKLFELCSRKKKQRMAAAAAGTGKGTGRNKKDLKT